MVKNEKKNRSLSNGRKKKLWTEEDIIIYRIVVEEQDWYGYMYARFG